MSVSDGTTIIVVVAPLMLLLSVAVAMLGFRQAAKAGEQSRSTPSRFRLLLSVFVAANLGWGIWLLTWAISR